MQRVDDGARCRTSAEQRRGVRRRDRCRRAGEPDGPKGFAIEALDGDRPRFAGTVDFRPDGAGRRRGRLRSGAVGARTRGHDPGAAAGAWAGRSTAMELEVVHWRANVGNWASRRVAWACGFRFEGTVRALLRGARRAVRRLDRLSLLRDEPDRRPAARGSTPPVLVGQPVVLRPWRDEDVPRIVETLQRPGRPNAGCRTCPRRTARATPRAWLLGQRTRLAEGTASAGASPTPADDRCVGSIDVFGLERTGNEAEVGYRLHPEDRGRGRDDARRSGWPCGTPSSRSRTAAWAWPGWRCGPPRPTGRRAGWPSGSGFREIGVQRGDRPAAGRHGGRPGELRPAGRRGHRALSRSAGGRRAGPAPGRRVRRRPTPAEAEPAGQVAQLGGELGGRLRRRARARRARRGPAARPRRRRRPGRTSGRPGRPGASPSRKGST